MEKEVSNKKAIIAIIVVVALLIILVMVYANFFKNGKTTLKRIENIVDDNNTEKKYSENIETVATLEDEITSNSVWCGTFQLVWNDMVNNVVKQDVVFTPQKQIVENLNKQTFKEDQISEKDYYKTYDLLTLDLKAEIEKAIKEKFNEKSDILDDIDWSSAPQNYLFYTMLKKEFNFENDFNELDTGKFGTKYSDIRYFGISEDSDSKLYNQVEVLYYNSENDFAVILNTKEGEQVILSRGAEGNNFGTIYNNIVKKSNEYEGNKEFTENDYLKVPNIKFNTKKEFKELCDEEFYAKDGDSCEIKKAIQTIELEMDKSGGKIKSEAAIVMVKEAAIVSTQEVEYRYFYLDDEFTMFLKEKDKEMPYFAANVEDITLFQ